mmetsp:Transcript_33128/g.38365  ORF Transcript_33128/g.38365 Transcript_33128/m.38365 type:complete len:90 (-) Transcript_33128:168-437(-)
MSFGFPFSLKNKTIFTIWNIIFVPKTKNSRVRSQFEQQQVYNHDVKSYVSHCLQVSTLIVRKDCSSQHQFNFLRLFFSFGRQQLLRLHL